MCLAHFDKDCYCYSREWPKEGCGKWSEFGGVVDGGVNIELSCVLARENISLNRRVYSLQNGNNWPCNACHEERVFGSNYTTNDFKSNNQS